MKLGLVCVGRMARESRPLCDHYLSLLRPYAAVEVCEVESTPLAEGRARVIAREGEAILRCLKPGAFVVGLDQAGREFTSEELSAFLAEQKLRGASHFQFILGGALGLDRRVLAVGKLTWSLSRLTFPHQLARCIVLEQLYRAIRIERGEPYHY